MASFSALGLTAAFLLTLQSARPVQAAGEVIEFASATYLAAEDAGLLEVSLVVAPAPVDPLTVTVTSTPGTALSPADFTAVNQTVSIAPGALVTTFTVTLNGDALYEGNEAFSLALSNPISGQLGAVSVTVVTLTDNETAPAIQFNSAAYAANEAEATAPLTATLSVASAFTTSVTVSAADVTLTGGVDFTPISQTVAFPPGATQASFALTPSNDAVYEGAETATLSLSNPVNGTLGAQATATFTLNDDEAQPTVQWSAASASVGESAGSATLTATLNRASAFPVTVTISTTHGTAGAADYTPVAAALVIPAGATLTTTTVAITADTLDELAEAFTATLSAPTNATLGAITSQTVTITDDDAPPTVALSTAALTVGEAAGTVTLTATLSAASGLPVTAPFTVGGTATGGGTDHSLAAGSFSFAAGSQTATVNFTVTSDALDEADETVIATLSAPTNATLGAITSQTVTLTDDDAPPTLSIGNVTVTEGNAGTVNAVFNVTLSAASGLPISVNYLTADGTATTADADFDLASGALAFPAGATSRTITVTVNGDTRDEGASEAFVVDLSSPANATLLDAQGQGTITDDDNPPTVAFTTATQNVAESGLVTVTAQLSAASGLVVTAPFSVGGTATGGVDHNLSAGALTFPAGAQTSAISFSISADSVDEDNETIVATLTSPTNASLGAPAAQTLTILDDDVAPTLTLADAALTESNTSQSLVFTATLNAASGRALSVNYATEDDTTTAGADYTAASGTLTFAAGQTTQWITITVAGDARDELNERFFINLTSPVNVILGGIRANGQILDDDPTPNVGFAAASSAAAENGGVITLTVNLTATSNLTVTVPYDVTGGTATVAVDYTFTNGVLAFAPGATAATFTVTPVNDALDELNETLLFTLGTPANAGLGSPAAHTLTLTDDDAPPTVQLSAAAYSLNEDTGPAVITATLSAPSGLTVTAAYATSPGTATAGSDYTTASGTITFTAGLTQTTFTLPVTADTTFENNEAFSVALSAPGNATLGAPSSATITLVNDDPQPTVSFAQSAFTVVEDTGGVGAANNTAVITATLSNASINVITVNYATADGTADNGADYTAASGTLTFPAGATTQAFTVTTLAEDVSEPGADETVLLTLSAPTGGASLGSPNPATLNIVDNDGLPTVRFATSTQSVAENAGSVTALLSLSNPSQSVVTVTVTTADGTALAAQDYTAVTRPITFTPGDIIASVVIPLLNESVYEASETFSAAVSSPVNATLGSTNLTHVITVLNDDPVPAVTFSSATYNVNEAGPQVTLTAQLSNPSAFTATVAYATSNGSASAGSDYTAATGTLTFTAGATSQIFTVAINNDGVYEGNETFAAALSAPNGVSLGVPGSATITILDNDSAPVVGFTPAAVSVAEDGGSATITVVITGSRSSNATVNYATTTSGTATPGVDYTAVSGSLVFTPGVSSRTFSVPIVDNNTYEGNETVSLALSTPLSATLGAASATLTILEEDSAPVLVFGKAAETFVESGGAQTVAVNLTGATDLTTTVTVTSSNGTAQSGLDFTAVNSTLTFPPGATSRTVTVTILSDNIYEGNEAFTLGLSAPGNATLGITRTLAASLTDDDSMPSVQLNAATYTLGENVGPVVLTATLSHPSAFTVQVNYAAANGTAKVVNDFAAASGTLTFPAGVLTRPLTVTLVNDAAEEPNETFSVGLSAPSGALAGAVMTTIVTIANDDARAGCQIYTSVDVPKLIPDNSYPTGVESLLVIPGPGQIVTDLSVRVDRLTHTFMGDVHLRLIAPDGREVILINGIGGDHDNLVYTVFNDTGLSMAGNFPPYTGTFAPNTALPALGQLDTMVSAGTWRLRVSDDEGGDVGTLHSWGLEVCGGAAPNYRVFLPVIRR